MKNLKTTAVATAVIACLSATASAEQKLSHEEVSNLFAGANGTFYSQSLHTNLDVQWLPDGKLIVNPANAVMDAEVEVDDAVAVETAATSENEVTADAGPDVKADAEPKPFSEGKWWIKTVEAEEDETPEQIAARNSELRYMLCHSINEWNSGHPTCFNVYQTSFNIDGATEEPLPTQEYKFRREGEVQVISFDITRR